MLVARDSYSVLVSTYRKDTREGRRLTDVSAADLLKNDIRQTSTKDCHVVSLLQEVLRKLVRPKSRKAQSEGRSVVSDAR